MLVRRLALMVALVVVPAAVIEVYNASVLRADSMAAMRDEAVHVAASVSANGQVLGDTVRGVLLAVGIAADHAVASPAGCQNVIDRLGRSKFDLFHIEVLDDHDVVRCASDPRAIGTNLADDPDVARAKATGQFVMSDFQRGPFAEQAFRRVAVGWAAPGGARGTTLAQIPLAQVAAYVFGQPRPGGVDLAVIDGDWRKTVFAAGKPTLVAPMDVRQLAMSGEPALLKWSDGQRRYTAFIPLGPSEDAILAAGVQVAPKLARVDRLERQSMLLLGLTWAVSMLIAIRGAIVSIRRPIRVLERAVRQWRDGDRNARAALPGRSELSNLGHAFDEMADAISHSEQRARENWEILEKFMASSPDMLFVTRSDGVMLRANRVCREVNQWHKDISGIRDVDMVPAHMRESVRAAREEIVATGAVVTREFDYASATAGGTRHYQTLYAPLFDEGGRVFAIAGVGRDMTAIRQATAELTAAKERAEAADSSKTRFLAAAAHDLRQPLQAALLYSEVLLSLVQEPAEAGDAIAKCRRALTDTGHLLDSLLDVSRLDSGVVAVQRSRFPVQPLLEEVAASSRNAALEKGLDIQVASTRAIVSSDPVLLGRMLRNLVENAVRYTTQGGITIACEVNGEELRIAIRDTGIGIQPADLERIFEEFKQLHNSERDRSQGLGLGLSIVRRLSHLLGHTLTVNSEPGKGSSFVVGVEYVGDARRGNAEKTTAGVSKPGNGRVVVVVDDDVLILSSLELVLKASGFRVLAASDGDQALAMLDPERVPDVIVADYRLRGGVVGTDVITRIRSHTGSRVPALILTGELGGDARREAGRIGVDLLVKPVLPRTLIQAMEKCMGVDDALEVA